MSTHALTFDAISEATPGPKWHQRWRRSWPAYEAWFRARGGEDGPSPSECEAALADHMPELAPVYRSLSLLAGDDDLASRFLSTWCPPPYLGGCSLAARADRGTVRLVRNYDLSPDLNEGLLMRTEWTGMPVMGMVEFLWGLSDGINAAGLAVALAYGGSRQVARGFGVTTILRYVLETCATVGQARDVLRRVPSHMAYNITLADRHGATATVELRPGGGARTALPAIATNHQSDSTHTNRHGWTKTRHRLDHLRQLFADDIAPDTLGDRFLQPPLYQRSYAQGFGTLFTAVYDPLACGLTLRWPGHDWVQTLDGFVEGQRNVRYGTSATVSEQRARISAPAAWLTTIRPFLSPGVARALENWADQTEGSGPDWVRLGQAFTPKPVRVAAEDRHHDGICKHTGKSVTSWQ